jgi:hypothetical protein
MKRADQAVEMGRKECSQGAKCGGQIQTLPRLWRGLLFTGLALLAPWAQAQVLPGTFRLESSQGDASQPGFVWRVHQVATVQPNNNTRTEQQLAGLLGDNLADPNAQWIANSVAAPPNPSTAPISFDINGVINLNKVGGWWDGAFGPDDQMPGLPGITGGDENVAAELLTWLDLPAGWVTLVVNSDDGFRMTIGGANPIDKFAMLVGEFNGGRPPEDSYFSFYVEQAGLYAARCTWEQGCCGASIEISAFDWWGNRILVNDTVNGGIPAYRAVTAPARAYARKLIPGSGQAVRADAPVVVELVDGASPIALSSIELSIDGTVVAVARSRSGDVTTTTYNHVLPFVPGWHTASFVYVENGVTRTASWQFMVLNYEGPNGNFYEFVPAQNISWEDAKAAAEQRTFLCGIPGHLVTITSEEENVFVELLRQQSASMGAVPWGEGWAGAYQLRDQPTTKDGWFWVNNEGPLAGVNGGSSYANWHYEEPNDATVTPGFENNEENYLGLGLFGPGLGWNDDNVSHNNIVGYVVEYERPAVVVDIKPGSSSNPVYLDAPGKLPVAVLSSSTFDASKLNAATVRFGRTGTEASPVSYSLSDVNGDKRKDLVCQFNVQDTWLQCGDTAATLTATTVTGCPIKGTDAVQILRCPPYALSVSSMQDVNRLTDVFLRVTPILPGRTAPAVAQNIVLKSYDIFGKNQWAKTLQNTALGLAADGTSGANLQYQDILHGQNVKATMQVKDTVSGVLQVLTAEGRTLYRPDLAVTAPGPLEAFKGQFVNIFASVSELKGDLGAAANVYLKDANGAIIDTIPNIIVGPLGSAGVMFTTVFDTEGVQNLQIEVADVTPGDYDLANNRQSFTVNVVPPPTYYSAYYSHHEHDYFSSEANAYWINTLSEQVTNEYVSQTLYIPAHLQFPIGQVTLQVSADGIYRGNVDIADLPLLYGYDDGCYAYAVGAVNLGNNTTVYVQSERACWGYQQTYANVNRSTYTQVYYSEYHDLVWGGVYPYSYEYFDLEPWGALSSIETRFVVQDEAGTFGGNGNFGPIYYSPFDDNWDFYYSYFEPDDTRVTGYRRGYDAWASNFGIAAP